MSSAAAKRTPLGEIWALARLSKNCVSCNQPVPDRDGKYTPCCWQAFHGGKEGHPCFREQCCGEQLCLTSDGPRQMRFIRPSHVNVFHKDWEGRIHTLPEDEAGSFWLRVDMRNIELLPREPVKFLKIRHPTAPVENLAFSENIDRMYVRVPKAALNEVLSKPFDQRTLDNILELSHTQCRDRRVVLTGSTISVEVGKPVPYVVQKDTLENARFELSFRSGWGFD